MEALVIGVTVAGSFATAFVLQRAALAAIFRMIASDRTRR